MWYVHFITSFLLMTLCTGAFAFEQTDLTLTLKDLKYSSQDDEFEVDFETVLEPKENDSMDYELDFEIDFDKSVDSYDKTTVEETEITLDWKYEYKKVFPYDFSYTNSFNYAREKESDTYTKENDYKVGLFGIKRHLYDDDTISEFSLNYIPLFRSSTYDKPSDVDDSYTRVTERSLLHRLELILDFSFMDDKLELSNTVKLEKISKLDTELDSGAGVNFKWDFTTDYQILQQLSIGVEYILDKESQRKSQGIDETKHTATFTLSINL